MDEQTRRTFRFKSDSPKVTASITMEIERTKGYDKPVLHVTGKMTIYDGKFKCCEHSGQMREEAEQYFNGDPLFDEINRLWKEYHLNDLNPGTPEQLLALDEHHAALGSRRTADSYKEDCEYLKSVGLYQVKLSDGADYEYGHGWLYAEIPKNDLDMIERLLKLGRHALKQRRKGETDDNQ